jgi:hypothetical protein
MPTLAANGQRLDDEMPVGLQGTMVLIRWKLEAFTDPNAFPATRFRAP